LTLIDDARSSIDEIRYLGPFRDSPRRSYRTPSDLPAVVGPLGSDAPAILASDFIRGQGDILRRVNTGLSDAASAWELRLDPAATNFALQFVSRVDDSLTVNFADTGVGLSQVLPILVQTARDMEAGPALHPTLNIVEQPELHLHPAAHAGLADLYLASVATGRSRYIIETHSENFVLRVRRRIAEGLDLSCVGLYFIEHDGVEATLNPIPIDSQGRVQNWPHGVFSEDVNEVRAISAARTEPLPQD
jgi:predicted ATPase